MSKSRVPSYGKRDVNILEPDWLVHSSKHRAEPGDLFDTVGSLVAEYNAMLRSVTADLAAGAISHQDLVTFCKHMESVGRDLEVVAHLMQDVALDQAVLAKS